MIDFEESGMRFQFTVEKSFHVEKSEVYDKRLNGHGVCSVECITLRGEKVLFIEAKSSAPNPDTASERFFDYIRGIVRKFQDSLSLCEAIHSNLWSGKEIGDELAERLWNCPKIVFVLIIQHHKKEWLREVQDGLTHEMNALLKIWRAEVIAINQEQALKFGLIVS